MHVLRPTRSWKETILAVYRIRTREVVLLCYAHISLHRFLIHFSNGSSIFVSMYDDTFGVDSIFQGPILILLSNSVLYVCVRVRVRVCGRVCVLYECNVCVLETRDIQLSYIFHFLNSFWPFFSLSLSLSLSLCFSLSLSLSLSLCGKKRRTHRFSTLPAEPFLFFFSPSSSSFSL